jgi:predicted nicotinamide N-methyase
VLTEDVIGSDRGWDVVLAGDVSYQKDMAEATTSWLEAMARRDALALIGDPRRRYLALGRLEGLIEYDAPTPRALEDADVKRAGVFRFRAPLVGLTG